MANRFFSEIERLRQDVLTLCTLVEESVRVAVISVSTFDRDLAKQTISADREIDRMEVAIEEKCLKLIAIYQPLAKDLRFLISVLKINNELERIADLAVNIAERTLLLTHEVVPTLNKMLAQMSDDVRKMLNMSIKSLVDGNPNLAMAVCDNDKSIDTQFRVSFRVVKLCIISNPHIIDNLLLHASLFKILERIADQTVNIAQDVIYMLNGDIVRHMKSEKRSRQAYSYQSTFIVSPESIIKNQIL